MTRRQIVLTIDAEDETCGDRCSGFSGCGCKYLGSGKWNRGPECLAAERKLARLIEEGEYMRKDYYHKDEPCGWDAAVEEVRK